MDLRELLQMRMMSQAELARRAKVSPATVSRILNGSRFPSLRMLDRMADALGVPGDLLYRLLRDQQREGASAGV